MTARHPPTRATKRIDTQPARPEAHERTLAVTQQAIMEAEIRLPEPFAYTLVSAVRATGVPDWPALIDAIRVTISRHDVFSWQLTLDSSYQVVAEGGGSPHFDLEKVDLRDEGPAGAEAAASSRLKHERRRAIKLLGGLSTPYTRLIIFRMPAPGTHDETAICALVTHHILVDEHATELIWDEIFQRATGRDQPAGRDRRYADWSQSSVSAAAEAASRQAAHEVATHLLSVPLGTIPQPPPGRGEDDTAPQIRLALPATLTAAAAARAAAMAVPVTAVYTAAFTEALTVRTRAGNFAAAVYATRRKTAADLDVVGCYISQVPMLTQAAPDGESRQATIARSYQELRFASDHAHAHGTAIRTATGWTPQVSLAFESPRAKRSARPIAWALIPPPDSVPKHDLSMFISPGTRGLPGEARLLWRPGVLDTASGEALAAQFLAHAHRLATDP